MELMTECPAPRKILSARFGYIAARAIGVAVELDVFTHINHGCTTLSSLAAAAAASPRGLRLLVDALVVQGLLLRNGGTLSLPAESQQFLVSDRPGYIGGMILHADRHWNRWDGLGEAVRNGTAPNHGVESDGDGGRYFAPFVAGLHQLNLPASRRLAAELRGVRKVLDVGTGSGVWSLPLACTGAQVVAVDREEVLQKQTLEYARQAGCESQYTLQAGNFREVAFASDFDLVILGHVLHSEGPERSRVLLKRALGALKPGGYVMIAEMIPDADRCSDFYGVLFGLNMLMLTEDGDVFTAMELEQMLAEAGFDRTRWLATPSLYPLLLAQRPTQRKAQ